MRTYSGLWDKFIPQENWNLALTNAVKNKNHQAQVREFMKNPQGNLSALRNMVLAGEFHTSPYTSKIIYEPKERYIYILPFQDRVVHHALLNVLIPIFESWLIKDSYACVANRGQIKASHRTAEAVRRNQYCLECDIHHAYPSIKQQLISDMLHKRFPYESKLMAIIDDIIFSFPGEDRSHLILMDDYEPGRNLPIGNVTSQWFFNVFLTELDNFCKHILKIVDYIRFSDNFNSYSNDKNYLRFCLEEQGNFLDKMGLKFSKANILNVNQGVTFVGYTHRRSLKNPGKVYITVKKATSRRIKKKVRIILQKYTSGKISKDKLRSTLDSFLGWLKHGKSYHFIKANHILEMRNFYIDGKIPKDVSFPMFKPDSKSLAIVSEVLPQIEGFNSFIQGCTNCNYRKNILDITKEKVEYV